ncbi:TraB/GumN family protein [Ornithinibacillus bavariensis]|uniref:TraB/GumN family protein n=1 Tax=Ornithinibacillus bavariensis TaxID=545502 RepID=A0A919X9U8_9BACI|nr:TraB/GumN family protein [Ornithinibacillus bavariensis]GIO27037.1 hypothetical protein J43TS3_16480 [Ornithinibacillus bavariensis]
MKRFFSHLVLLLILFVVVSCQANEKENSVLFSDYQLEQLIREEINQPEGDIQLEALQKITSLNLSSSRIKSIDGLEYLDKVTNLNLENNRILDFSPLVKMDSLKEVSIGGNPYDESTIAKLEAKNIVVHSKVMVAVRGEPDGPGGFLWKVDNGNTTVYLQGTIHIATEAFFPLNQKIEEAYAEADIIVPEIDLNNINLIETQALYLELATYSDGSSIEDNITSSLYAKLKNTYSELNSSVDMFSMYQPWFHSTLIQQLMNEELGYIEGVDMYFLDRAEHDQKKIIALETVEEQLSLFADTTPKYQVQMLEESLVDIDDYGSQMEKLFSLYVNGDSEALLSYLIDEDGNPSAEEQAFMEALNDKRNYKMAEKIAGFLEEDSGDTYLVIVGSLHLLLEPHIRSILEEKGYTIERVL